ncbi:thiamine pyrophosphate-binding protein [Actinacidiphila glaucinigra]|uniref:alpha-keto acid decarboxylase family protein n=1 Tax=Actinacidiphila glaucinigra TaxID=235986 RepID=UPI0033B84935
MTDDTPAIVADHLLDRLADLGVSHVFGVPGDYNLAFLDRVLAHPRMTWVGTANELGAAYAADGYARIAGFGALLTTHGVGELSAINAVAGSYAEYVPLLHVAVGPARAVERSGAVLHHTFGDADFERFARAHAEVVCAHATLRPGTAADTIDRVLGTAVRNSRPAYLRLPSDVGSAPVTAPAAPARPSRSSAAGDGTGLAAFTRAARARLERAGTVTVLADFLVDRFGARAELTRLLAAGPLPHATPVSGKDLLDEGNPLHLGVYSGAFSDPVVRALVDEADLLIRAGVVLADTTSGGLTHGFDTATGIGLGPHSASVDGLVFPDVPLRAGLAMLAELVADRETPPTPHRTVPTAGAPAEDGPLTQDRLWNAVAAAVRPGDVVAADQGTAYYGMATRRLPAGTRFLGQPLWGSIGYTLPALLGAQLADRSRRGVLLIGDGSAQMTVQELGTFGRHGLAPVIVLVNNRGYTVERVIHGARAAYNDIAAWDWPAVPAALGVRDPLVATVRTGRELDAALDRAARTPGRLAFIEAVTGLDDVPPLLGSIAHSLNDRNTAPA